MAGIVIRSGGIGSAEEEGLSPVSFQVVETDDRIELTASVRDFTEEDIEVRLRGGRLTVTGYRADPDGGLESGAFLGFQQSFPLPPDVRAGQVRAALDDGVLVIDIEKQRGN